MRIHILGLHACSKVVREAIQEHHPIKLSTSNECLAAAFDSKWSSLMAQAREKGYIRIVSSLDSFLSALASRRKAIPEMVAADILHKGLAAAMAGHLDLVERPAKSRRAIAARKIAMHAISIMESDGFSWAETYPRDMEPQVIVVEEGRLQTGVIWEDIGYSEIRVRVGVRSLFPHRKGKLESEDIYWHKEKFDIWTQFDIEREDFAYIQRNLMSNLRVSKSADSIIDLLDYISPKNRRYRFVDELWM